MGHKVSKRHYLIDPPGVLSYCGRPWGELHGEMTDDMPPCKTCATALARDRRRLLRQGQPKDNAP